MLLCSLLTAEECLKPSLSFPWFCWPLPRPLSNSVSDLEAAQWSEVLCCIHSRRHLLLLGCCERPVLWKLWQALPDQDRMLPCFVCVLSLLCRVRSLGLFLLLASIFTSVCLLLVRICFSRTGENEVTELSHVGSIGALLDKTQGFGGGSFLFLILRRST